MRLFSWNVNGLRAVAKKGFFEWIEMESPDILCLQETKLQYNQLEDSIKNIEGYYSYFNFAEKKGYSGVAVYTKIKPINVELKIGIDKFDNEGRIIIAEFEKFTLMNIYFPNGSRGQERLDYKLEFYNEILKYCNNLEEKGKRLIICGDYNTAHQEIDIKNAKANMNNSGFLDIERKWIDKFIQSGHTDTYRYFYPSKVEYSWWSYLFDARKRNAGWRLDCFFVSNNFLKEIKDAAIYTNVMGSDHCPVMLEIRN